MIVAMEKPGRFRRLHITNIFCLVVLSVGLLGCNGWPWPSVEYDYSRLGDTPLDAVVKNDTEKYHDFPSYPNNQLERTNPLVQNIIDLLYRNKPAQVTASDIEDIGGTCKTAQPELCVYHGTISYQYSGLPSNSLHEGKTVAVKYTVQFYLDYQPVKVEVTRERTES